MGKVALNRTVLIAADQESADRLMAKEHKKSLLPLDEALGIDRLPFKLSTGLLLACAYQAQIQPSFQAAEETLLARTGVSVNDDTLRAAAHKIGTMAFSHECKRAENALSLSPSASRPGTFCIRIDTGLYQNRKTKDTDLFFVGTVFAAVPDKDGILKVKQPAYTAVVGDGHLFARLLASLASDFGASRYERLLLFTDGTPAAAFAVNQFQGADILLSGTGLYQTLSTANAAMAKEFQKALPPEGLQKKRCGTMPNLLSLQKIWQKQNHYSVLSSDTPLPESDGESFAGLAHLLLRPGILRWDPDSLQALLTLRARALSGCWHSEVEVPFLASIAKTGLSLNPKQPVQN